MYSHILIPVLFDEEHPSRAAEEIARHLSAPQAKVTFLHVMEEVPAYAINYIPVEHAEATLAAIKDALAEKAARFGNGASAVVRGHAGRGILEFAEDNGVDLIVISSHRPGLSDYFLGSTASRVVRHAQCAVHVLR